MHLVRNLFALLILLALSVQCANACSCLKRTDIQKFRDAQAVVVGVVQELHYVEDQSVFGGGYIRAVIKVSETLKGKIERRIEVKDQVPEGGMCSSFLRAGIEFVFFIEENLEVGMCSGTQPLGATIYDRPEKIKALQLLKSKAGS
ncbi:hypothetical protein O4G98_20730 [Zoogloeaceae bacterium G21618-S1]|nr:hypothetical protein [Zoogloeaceae bacterium G21618-S1]